MIEAFVGKGGVGKTTIASSYAMLCSQYGRTAIISTDTMPSLRYLFPNKIENLSVYEISEKDITREWIEKYGDEVYSILSNFFEADRDIVDHVANAPGVAEEFMISKITEMNRSNDYDYIIWDTPASSSTMHLLYLENDFYNHIGRDIRFYLKMKDSFKVTKTLDILNEWRNLAKDVWNEVQHSNFYIVHTDDELTIIQSSEIEKELRELGIKIEATISNRTQRSSKGLYVPELEGSAREIIQEAEPYIFPLFEMVHDEYDNKDEE
ncbi:MAG: ArsA family ATPase [Thermoplasmata archaeon]